MPTGAIHANGTGVPRVRRKSGTAKQHAEWLGLYETGDWPYRRIAAMVGKSVAAVFAGIASARRAQSKPTLDEETRRYIEAKYRNQAAASEWLIQQNRRLD